MISITPIYAACIAILMAVLATATSMSRGKAQVMLGDADDPSLRVSIRRFGNLSEFAAIALILLLLLEFKGVSAVWLHAFGATFVGLRVLHALVLRKEQNLPKHLLAGRFVASAGTSVLLIIGAVALLAN